jgi:hypothetical protein
VGEGGALWDGLFGSPGEGQEADLHLDSTGRPVIVFKNGPSRYFARFDAANASWSVLPTPGGAISFALSHKNQPVVAWADGNGKVFVQTPNSAGTGWQDFASPFDVMDPNVVLDAALVAFDQSDGLVVVYLPTYGGAAQHTEAWVVRWNGSAWVRGLKTRADTVSAVFMTLDNFGRAVLAWSTGSPSENTEQVVVVQANAP